MSPRFRAYFFPWLRCNIAFGLVFVGWWLTGAWQNTFPFARFRPDVPIIDQFFPWWVMLCAQVVPIVWVAWKRRHIRTDTTSDHPSGSGR